MKTLLTILLLCLSLMSCKKKDTKPQPPPPPPAPIVCTDKPESFVGAYYTYNTGAVDTCYITFIESTCFEKSRYLIRNLSGVFETWAIEIPDTDYVIPASKSIPDSLVMIFEAKAVQFSVRAKTAKPDSTAMTPYLRLKKRVE